MGYVQRDYTLQEAYDSVGKGWHGLLYRLYMLRQHYPFKVVQVKEKFGGLRFYIDAAPDGMHGRIWRITEKSYRICEVCGRPGKIRPFGWVKTLCWRHNIDRLRKNKYIRRHALRYLFRKRGKK